MNDALYFFFFLLLLLLFARRGFWLILQKSFGVQILSVSYLQPRNNHKMIYICVCIHTNNYFNLIYISYSQDHIYSHYANTFMHRDRQTETERDRDRESLSLSVSVCLSVCLSPCPLSLSLVFFIDLYITCLCCFSSVGSVKGTRPLPLRPCRHPPLGNRQRPYSRVQTCTRYRRS